jgi:putative transcriptional regulator
MANSLQKQARKATRHVGRPKEVKQQSDRPFANSSTTQAEMDEDLAYIAAVGRGEIEPDAILEGSTPLPAAIRARLELTQLEFATLLGISIRTLQDWEQGRREPTGPAKTLLRIVDKDPDVLLRVWRKS